MSYCSNKNNSRTWKPLKHLSTEEQEHVVHIYSRILSATKKMKKSICRDLEIVIQRSKPEREKQMSCNIAYVWNLENAADELIHKAEIETQL